MQSSRELPGRRWGGRQAGRCSTYRVSRASGDLLLEEETAFGLIYILATSSAAAYVDPCQVARYSKLSTTGFFPDAPRASDPRPSRVLGLPHYWQDQSYLEAGSYPSAQAAGTEMAATQERVPFIPIRLQATGWIPLKRKWMGGRYAKVRNIMK